MTGTGSDGVSIDVAGVASLAAEMRRSAETIAQHAGRLDAQLFGTGRGGAESEAGRNYAAHGEAVHAGLERISHWLRQWSRAVSATADALGTAGVDYSTTERENARRIAAAGNQ
ncbi:hypothetical protein [Nocardia terpenica]|uniref:ESX-1 secretion-associated protein n=1 Tax=Nocardia terpenica TaxID=455432 RepID=A0A164IA90_9NOCA|nr:hypothetical protein [Nocardia terpenica]KZM69243.1 hypothetical protein AWN90_16165 [Nocardia terpenica]NQE87631.1 hypothetical protein [Nocardia terpenica]